MFVVFNVICNSQRGFWGFSPPSCLFGLIDPLGHTQQQLNIENEERVPISILDPINESIHVEIAQAHLLLVISLMNPVYTVHSDVLGQSMYWSCVNRNRACITSF